MLRCLTGSVDGEASLVRGSSLLLGIGDNSSVAIAQVGVLSSWFGMLDNSTVRIYENMSSQDSLSEMEKKKSCEVQYKPSLVLVYGAMLE